jgi:tetratricopeptide (TPR) repeat protein
MIAPEDWLALPVPWLTYLAFWLPELQVFVRVGEPPVEIFSHQFYSLLQEAIRQLLESLAKHQKLVLIVDDLQWADEATVNTLVYLCERSPFNLGSLMLLSTRMEDPNPHLTAWLPVLMQTQRFRQIQIPGLSREEVISLCTLAFREPISTNLGEQLHQMTQGNPYFVLETIRSMLEQGISPHDLKPNQPLPVPDTIKQLLWSRLQQVSMTASHYLAAAAVFGRQFPIQTIGEIVDLSRTQIAQALEELELRALLIPVENNPEQRQFAHDQIRETLLEHIHPSRQQALHELVFYALLEQQKKDVLPIAGLLAQHAEQAGLWSQAFDHYVLAGKNGYRTFALEETIRAYERADLMIDQFSQHLSDQQIYDLYSEWNDLAFELDRPDLVETLNKRLLVLGKQRNSPLLIGVALDGLSDYCMAINKFEAGLDYTNQALDYIQQVDNPFEYTEIMMHKGVFLYMLNRLAEAEQTFGTARNSISRSNDAKSQRSRSSLFYHLAILNTLIGKPAVARLYAMASLKHGRLSKYPHNIISAYAALVFTSHFAGMYHEGLQSAASGIEYARQHKAWRMLAYLHGYQSMTQLVCGQLDDALASAQQARQSAQHHNHHEIIAFSYRLEGDIHLSMGNIEQAKEQYLACLHHGKDSFWGLDGLSRLGIAQIRSGSPDIGQELALETIQLADKSGLRLVSLITRAALAESLLDLGKTTEAKQLASEVLEACQKTCLPAVWIGVNAVLGNCASRELDKPAAKFYLTRAFDHNKVLQDCWLEVILLMHIKQSSQWLSEIVVPEQKFVRRIENLKAHLLQTTTRPDFKDAIHALSGKLAIS